MDWNSKNVDAQKINNQGEKAHHRMMKKIYFSVSTTEKRSEQMECREETEENKADSTSHTSLFAQIPEKIQ